MPSPLGTPQFSSSFGQMKFLYWSFPSLIFFNPLSRNFIYFKTILQNEVCTFLFLNYYLKFINAIIIIKALYQLCCFSYLCYVLLYFNQELQKIAFDRYNKLTRIIKPWSKRIYTPHLWAKESHLHFIYQETKQAYLISGFKSRVRHIHNHLRGHLNPQSSLIKGQYQCMKSPTSTYTIPI